MEAVNILPSDTIVEIGIDNHERLYIRPGKQTFEYIWRAAAEVGWDNKEKILFSPKPREWTYYMWYKHIVSIAKEEYGCVLFLTANTNWTNIPENLKEQIITSK
ncbi:MAG: hypothetical protein EOO46_20850 [Flavobacterium sp.]|nr:MAG: hypothetical protein EOO46_20850 [Flavobacterium sp.]